MPEKQCMELHDSTFAKCYFKDGVLHIRLNKAIIHSSDNRPAIDAGKVYTQDFEFMIHHCIEKEISALTDVPIQDGSISVNDLKFKNIIPLPFQKKGAVEIELLLAGSDEKISVTGMSIAIIPTGEMTYLEDWISKD